MGVKGVLEVLFPGPLLYLVILTFVKITEATYCLRETSLNKNGCQHGVLCKFLCFMTCVSGLFKNDVFISALFCLEMVTYGLVQGSSDAARVKTHHPWKPGPCQHEEAGKPQGQRCS